MHILQKIKIPSVPKFIDIEMPNAIRDRGGFENPKLPISEFTESQLREIGKQWTANLVKEWRIQRKNKKEQPITR